MTPAPGSRASAPRLPPRSLAPAVLVMGKGGVGKTTVAAALATLEAETHGLAVLVEFSDGESGRRALGPKHQGVEHVVIQAAEAIQRASTPLFGSATVAKMALGNFAMRPLLKAAPAIRELAMLESVRQVVAARPGVRVVVDMPATGHAVAWLRTAKQGRDFLGSGPMFDLCDRVARELVAPGCASIVVVTLPERLVLEETLELCESIARDPGLEVARIVVNRVPLPLAQECLVDARALVRAGGSLAPPAAALVSLLEAREAASAGAMTALEVFAHGPHAIWRVPLAPADPTARDVARWLRAEGAA